MSLKRRTTLGLLAAVAGAGALVASAPSRALNLLAAVDSRQAGAGLPYGPLPRQRYDAYRPPGTPPREGWPLVVFFYGGSWNRGERADYRFVGEALAARGMLVLVADYRLYPQVTYPDFLHDCAAAVAHALAQARSLGADPARVFVMGHSAGAYNAAMLALDPRWLRAAGHEPGELAGWIGLAGPYDFLPITNPDARPVFHHPDVPLDSQPLHHAANPPALPVFLGAAARDDLVNPLRNTRGLAAALQAAGRPVTLRLYERVNHMTLVGAFAAPLRWLAPVLDDVAGFVAATPAIQT